MNYKIFSLYLYSIYIIIGKSYCEDIFKEEYETNSNDFINNYINSYLSPNLPPFNDNNFICRIMNSKYYQKEKMKVINPGQVQSILLFKETFYILKLKYFLSYKYQFFNFS